MTALGPLPPILGAIAMIGLAAATAFGLRRGGAEVPEVEPGPVTPVEAMRAALAFFAHWLPGQPEAVRQAVARPAERLLSSGANLVEALGASGEPERLMGMAAVVAAEGAFVRDLPETVAILDALPMASRAAPRALVPFASAVAVIADAADAAWEALQADAIASLDIQERYLNSKYPGD